MTDLQESMKRMEVLFNEELPKIRLFERDKIEDILPETTEETIEEAFPLLVLEGYFVEICQALSDEDFKYVSSLSASSLEDTIRHVENAYPLTLGEWSVTVKTEYRCLDGRHVPRSIFRIYQSKNGKLHLFKQFHTFHKFKS